MTTQFCTQCGAELAAEALFCSVCGAPQSGQGRRHPKMAHHPGRSPLPVLLLIVGVLLLVGGSLVYLLNRPEAVPAAIHTPAAVESDIPYPEVVRISVEEAKAQVEAGTAVLLDVRPFEDYQTLHATNAISIPLDELTGRTGELPQDAEILTYCT
jgi:hypothetical protein